MQRHDDYALDAANDALQTPPSHWQRRWYDLPLAMVLAPVACAWLVGRAVAGRVREANDQ